MRCSMRPLAEAYGWINRAIPDGAEFLAPLDMRFAGREHGKLAQKEVLTGIIPRLRRHRLPAAAVRSRANA